MKHGEMAKHTLNGGKKILCGMLCRCGQAPRKISAVSVSGSSAVTFWSAALSLTTNKRNDFEANGIFGSRDVRPDGGDESRSGDCLEEGITLT